MIRDALVVGINTYTYERLPSLTAPAIDAEAIAKLLERYGQFNVKRLPSVKDKENNTARVGQKTSVTLTQLEEAIVQLFKPEGKNAPDTALLYFSGHGLRKNRGIQQGFLATSDVNPDLGNWGLSLQWLRQLLQESEVKQQIIWLDCCYSGELLNFAEADPGDRGKGRDRCFIAASREFEVAYEAIGSNHSVLTEALLQGLDPQRSPEVWVTNYTLIDFLHHHWDNYPQRPIFANSGSAIDLTRTWQHQKQESGYAVTGSVCPYRGLQYFDCKKSDAEYFFGREALTDQLLEKVRCGNFLAVLGASGSGKSSVVRAGLLYQIHLGRHLSGSENWQIKIFRPGEHPLQSLGLSFLDSGLSDIDRGSQLAKVEELLAKGGVGLGQLINAIPAERVVLVADQFEEAFTLCQNISERQRFFESLLGALPHTGNKICLVLTMRADFFGKCAEQDYSGLAQQIQEHLVTVTPMTPEELTQAIVEPAKRVELEIEPELVTQILADVGDAPGTLPLLQYTLTELWKQNTDKCLRVNTYVKLGGVMGTLRQRATEVYELFSEEQKPVMRHIFLSLTQLGEGTEDTRRHVQKDDLVSEGYSEELINKVVQRLVDEKLIVTTEKVQKGKAFKRVAVVDIAHEALIRHWSLLRKWIDENRDNLRQKRKIESLAEEWRNSRKSKDYLLQGKLLRDTCDWQQQHLANQILSNLAEEFIKASIKQRRDNRLKSIGFGLIAPVGLAVFLGVFGVNLLTIRELRQTLEKSQGLGRVQALQELVKRGVSLNGIILLRRNDFSSADLSNAKLSGADLSGTIFINGKLRHVILSGAILSGADFSVADLRNADLSGAILSDVKLYNTILGGANLKGAKLSSDDLNSALLCNTIMPDGNVSNRDCAKITANSAPDNIDIRIRSPKAETATPQSPEEIKPQKFQRISLVQAVELARRNNQGSFAEMRLQVTLEYYDLQQGDELVRIAQSSVENAKASFRDAESLEQSGVLNIQDIEIYKLSRTKALATACLRNKKQIEALVNQGAVSQRMCTGKDADERYITKIINAESFTGRSAVLRSQVTLANALQDLTYILSQQTLSRRRLANRLGLPQSVDVSATDPVQLAGLWNLTLEDSIKLALRNRNGQQQQRNQISLEVEQAFLEMQYNLENIQTANTVLEQARETLRLDRLRFQLLIGSLVDVIQSQNLLTIAEKNRIRAIIDYNRGLAGLVRAVSSDKENPAK